MKLKKIILLMIPFICLGIVWKINADSAVVIKMANMEANTDEVFKEALSANKSQAILNIIDEQLLNKDYSYEKNDDVKTKVNEQIDQIKSNNPTLINEYGVKDEFELLKKVGSVIGIQRKVYAQDYYNKTQVTDKTLKALYDQRAGELINYKSLTLDLNYFSNDPSKLKSALEDVKAQLAKANKDNITEIFDNLVKKYPPLQETTPYGEAVEREGVNATLLKTLDKYQYLEFNKEPIVIDQVNYFVLKNDKGERTPFAQSKDRLKELQYEKAVAANASLNDYYLVLLRNKASIKFKDEINEVRYQAANNKIISDYQKALKGAK
ncbi:MAG: hypothetical protein LBT75_04555 [Bacilli bacterium]|nr:hypothetical protein [Bacilli bacterium]